MTDRIINDDEINRARSLVRWFCIWSLADGIRSRGQVLTSRAEALEVGEFKSLRIQDTIISNFCCTPSVFDRVFDKCSVGLRSSDSSDHNILIYLQ